MEYAFALIDGTALFFVCLDDCHAATVAALWGAIAWRRSTGNAQQDFDWAGAAARSR